MTDIDKIRVESVVKIKEKVIKNPGYLHPCNKERQIDEKRLGFSNGYEYTCWLQKIGIMKNTTDIIREQNDKTAKNANCKNWNEYQKELMYDKGIHSPLSDNKDCSYYFGLFIAQNYIIKTFEDPIEMPPNNPGFDWICKNGKKIDHKARCLCNVGNCIGWKFEIKYNNIADYFILSAWDNRDSLNPLRVWIFHKDDIIRGKKFWKREFIWITNTPKSLIEFKKYEFSDRLEKLKDLCKKGKIPKI